MVCNLSGHATAIIYCMYVSSFLSFNLEYKYTTANLPFFFWWNCESGPVLCFFEQQHQQQQQQQQ